DPAVGAADADLARAEQDLPRTERPRFLQLDHRDLPPLAAHRPRVHVRPKLGPRPAARQFGRSPNLLAAQGDRGPWNPGSDGSTCRPGVLSSGPGWTPAACVHKVG